MVLEEQPQVGSLRPAAFAYKDGDFHRALELTEAFEQQTLKNSETLLLKGLCYRSLKQPEAALPYLEEAVQHTPVLPDAWRALGHAYLMDKRYDDAMRCAKEYICACPQSALGYFDAGKVHNETLEYAQAVEMFQISLQKEPRSYESWLNLGLAYRGLRRDDDSIKAYDEALKVFPQGLTARKNKGYVLLRKGEWPAGWREYEYRTTALLRHPYIQPRWNGEFWKDKTLFIRTEQGFGDAIQFARFLPMVRQRVGRVILECRPALKTFFQENNLADVVIAHGDIPPSFDCHILTMSLAGAFGVTKETVPHEPYLKASDKSQKFAQKKLRKVKKFKIGLVWQGSVTHKNDRHRSIPLAELRPILNLAKTHEIVFCALQKPIRERDQEMLKEMEKAGALINFEKEITDYSATAGFVSQMDLMLCVDTSVAHLSGAMGKPVWTFIPQNPDWRWGLNSAQTPWYPNMTLIRQNEGGNWESIIAETTRKLADFLLKEGVKKDEI